MVLYLLVKMILLLLIFWKRSAGVKKRNSHALVNVTHASCNCSIGVQYTCIYEVPNSSMCTFFKDTQLRFSFMVFTTETIKSISIFYSNLCRKKKKQKKPRIQTFMCYAKVKERGGKWCDFHFFYAYTYKYDENFFLSPSSTFSSSPSSSSSSF